MNLYKKFLAMVCLFVGSELFSSNESLTLPFYRETEHFQAYCLPTDCPSADCMLQDLEQQWLRWNQKLFAISLSKKVTLNIFPDIQSYNYKIFTTTSFPQWRVCTANDQDVSISLVSPQNPGPMHTSESIMKTGRLCLGWLFTHQKYGYKPFWLCTGLSYNEVKIYSRDLVCHYLLKNNKIEIPALSDLEDGRVNADRPSLITCYILTEFLVNNWGLDKTLALLKDYNSFEKILGISKEEFRIRCAQYYQPHQSEKN